MQSSVRYPEIGDKLGNRFRLVFGRGSGPNGVVFKALDMALDLPVAIKVFNPDLFVSPFREQNLLRLYRARQYQDPNLIKIFELQEDRGFHFLSCQLLEGMSLAAVLDLHAESGEQFTLQKIRALLTRMLSGLEAIHKTGAIHGNLKPQNIFLLPDRLMLTDPYYLVVRPLQEGEEIPVADYYRAPEQLTDPSLELAQIDLYAAALIFGEIVGGNPVRPGVALSRQIPRLTTRFDDWFLRATAVNPLERHGSLAEFTETLLSVLDVVESEGLWQRRYHETGSFRAIRVVPKQEAVTPLVEPVPAKVSPEPAKKPELPQEAVEKVPEPTRPEPLRTEPIVTEPTPVVSEPTPTVAPEIVEKVPEAVEKVEEAVPAEAPAIEGAAVTVETEAIAIEEEGILVKPEPEEEAFEGIEVISEEAPPIPKEALEEEAPPIKIADAKAPQVSQAPLPIVEPPPAPAVMPEATGETLEMESVAKAETVPTVPMAPMQKVSGVGRPAEAGVGAPVRSLLLILAIFIVAASAVVIAALWLGREPPEPPQPQVAVAPKQEVAKPVLVQAPSDVVSDVAKEVAQPQDLVAPSAPPPPPPPKQFLADLLTCPAGMAKVVLDRNAPTNADPKQVAFCMDTHEYPGAGQKPKVRVALAEARALCAQAGKRLCTANEWSAACNKTYPYGNEYRSGACNVESGVLRESGALPECKTNEGIYDLVGNASEWAADGRVHGGDVSGGADNRCDTSSKRLLPGPTNGFRCCADAVRL